MKIEIWSDFVCPFCYIGKRRLDLALDLFKYKNEVELVFRSYELDPNADTLPNQNVHEYLASRKNVSLDHAKKINENIRTEASAVGLIYNFDTMKHTNTFDAHRVAKYAHTKKLGNEMIEKLLYAYFTDSELISDHQTLKRLAVDVGLNMAEVEDLLGTRRFSNRVREDEDLAKQLGVQGVPFFVFNEKYAVSGAQSKEVFIQVLEKVWQEEMITSSRKDNRSSKSKTSYCTGEGCEEIEE